MGRFGYTGHLWLAEVGLWYARARMYSPTLGRFLQTDPIGYGDGMNLYAYVGNDPVNFVDPLGLAGCSFGDNREDTTYVCLPGRGSPSPSVGLRPPTFEDGGAGRGNIPPWFTIAYLGADPEAIEVTARPRQGPIDPCSATAQHVAEALEIGGDIFIGSGLFFSGVGFAAVGPSGLAAGAPFTALGTLAGTAGQVVEDIHHGDGGINTLGRAAVNLFGGRVFVAGLRLLNRGQRAPLIDELFDESFSRALPRFVRWLDPERC